MKIKEYKNKKGEKRFKYHGYLGIDKITGKKVSITRQNFITKSDAKNDYIKQKNSFQSGKYNSKTKITFKEVYETWKKIYRSTVRESTFLTTTATIEKNILPYFEDMIFTEISTFTCQQFASYYCTKFFNGLRYYRMGKRIFKFANKNLKIISTNPFDDVILPKFIEPVSSPFFLELDEVYKLLNVIDDQLWYAFFMLLIHTGMRKSEARALKWSDFNFIEGTVKIDKTLSKAIGGDIIEDPKSKNGFRTIYIDTETLEVIKKLKNISKSIYLFSLNGHKPFASNMPNYYLDQYCQKANLQKITVHTLRHTHVTQCIDSGMNIVQVANRVGDTIESISKIYAHATNKRKIESIRNYEQYVIDNKKVNRKSINIAANH